MMSSGKRTATQPSNDVVDRISDLPESVLTSILSLLPTADAVSTSLLSTQWKFRWRNIRTLHFQDWTRDNRKYGFRSKREIAGDCILFEHFVNNVLIFLNEKCIDEFYLEIGYFSGVDYVTTWIAAAVSLNAKEIWFFDRIKYDKNEDMRVCFQMPHSLFTGKTLEALILDAYMELNVPSLVSLPNLKTLRLERVIYQCDESVRKLISGCTSLEKLTIRRDAPDNVVTFTISSPTLRNLTLYFGNKCSSFPTDLDYKLEINAPQLQHLELNDTFSKDFSFENLCLLDEANIKLQIDESWVGYDDYNKALVKLLQGLYNVKYLSLTGNAQKALSHASFSTSFLRLSKLTMEATCWTRSLLNIFEGSDKLEFVRLDCDDSAYETCWSEPEKVPICFLSSLKAMSFRRINGLEIELAMIAYILKNAKVLTTMRIQPTFSMDTEARLELLKKVSEFPRGSEECQLFFCRNDFG